MTIHGFTLPALLESHLHSGGFKLLDTELGRLKSMLTYIDSPRPRFWSHKQILSEHTLWSSPAATIYLGTENTDFFPGQVDPTRILMIGEADEDSPIALDYRTDNPRVVYTGSIGPQLFWIELASNYEEMIDKLTS
jgi:hypothetical protein